MKTNNNKVEKEAMALCLLSKKPTEKQLRVYEIIKNLPFLIKRFSSDFPVWGAKKRRTCTCIAPSSPPHLPPLNKPRLVAGPCCPTTPLSDDKTHRDSVKKVIKKTTKEELLETINKLAQAKESLTMELEKVKGYHNMLIDYNLKLKAKQQELKESEEQKKSISNVIKLTKNTNAPPLLFDNHATYFLHFTNMLQQQQRQLPHLNGKSDKIFYDIEHSQPFDQKAIENSHKAIAATEARKRRMIRIKERKAK